MTSSSPAVWKKSPGHRSRRLIRDHMITVSNKPVKANYRLLLHDRIQVEFPEPEVLNVLPEDIPLDILYEDKDLLIVNKPKQMVVHPAPGHPSGTLVNAVLYHCGKDLSGINGVLRPGIVHRIDMDTTGSLIICKNDLAHQKICGTVKGAFHQPDLRSHRPWKPQGGDRNHKRPHRPGSRHDRKKMSVHARNGQSGCHSLSGIGAFWLLSLISSAGWRPAAPTRSGSTWQASAIPFWGIRYMAQRNVPSPPCRDRLCTPGPSESVTPGQGPGWR